jgi:ATP-dependent protease HslVU (ClpYQ) peptidase subunit
LALCENTKMAAPEIAEKAIGIAGKICIYTNTQIIMEKI